MALHSNAALRDVRHGIASLQSFFDEFVPVSPLLSPFCGHLCADITLCYCLVQVYALKEHCWYLTGV
jgi:hypothetical protein